MMDTPDEYFIVELMGHIRLAGKVTADDRFGGKLSRIDIPGPYTLEGEETWVTQWFGTAGVYRITACTEETARAVAAISSPAPVHRYELPERAPGGHWQPYADPTLTSDRGGSDE